jgi:hypothetical protein
MVFDQQVPGDAQRRATRRHRPFGGIDARGRTLRWVDDDR